MECIWGLSLTNSRSVYLIFSIKTGLLASQFYVKFDEFFESFKWEKLMPRSEWQYKARLVRERPSSKPDLDRVTMTPTSIATHGISQSSTIDPGEETDIT